MLLRPFLEEWVTDHPALEGWQRELVRAVMAYEDYRLNFLNSESSPVTDGMMTGGDWRAFVSKVDIAAVFEAMQSNQPLTAELVKEWGIVLVPALAPLQRL